MSELISYAHFVEHRERRRTADRGRAFPGSVGPSLECEPVEPAAREPRTDGAMALAVVATPAQGPVPRWRARKPMPHR